MFSQGPSLSDSLLILVPMVVSALLTALFCYIQAARKRRVSFWLASLAACDHGGALRLYARQWLADAAAAEDAVQEAVVACWRRDPGLTATALPQVFVAVRHAALNLGRGERRRDVRLRQVAAEQQPCFICPQAADDLSEEVEEALARLPGAQREAVTLHLWSGLTFAEIGEVLDCNANTAASRYRYALAALRDLLSLPEERP